MFHKLKRLISGHPCSYSATPSPDSGHSPHISPTSDTIHTSLLLQTPPTHLPYFTTPPTHLPYLRIPLKTKTPPTHPPPPHFITRHHYSGNSEIIVSLPACGNRDHSMNRHPTSKCYHVPPTDTGYSTDKSTELFPH